MVATPDGLGWLLTAAVCIFACEPFHRGKENLKDIWVTEFVGVFFVVILTCSGWWDSSGDILGVLPIGWVFHAAGIVVTDRSTGAHCNTGVSIAFLCLGKLGLIECVARGIGQCVGAAAGFYVCQLLATAQNWQQPAFPMVGANDPKDALMSASGYEFAAMASLCLVVFSVNFEAPKKWSEHWSYYMTKMLIVAVSIRLMVLAFNGPSINPALSLGWMVFTTGHLGHFNFYLVYWIASISGALTATIAYALYAKVSFLGVALRKATAKAEPKTERVKPKRSTTPSRSKSPKQKAA